MCTLIVAFKQYSSAPLVIAANRDEVRFRPASGARRWPGEAFVAPRDLEAGGTWLGLTHGGLFAGVTNRFPSEKHAGRESRGRLVVETLRHASAQHAHEALQSLRPERFNAFHLLYADQTGAFVTWSDGSTVSHCALSPGLHVVTERSYGGADDGREALAMRAWRALPLEAGVPSPPAVQQLLAAPAPQGLCVDLPDFNYGTRSAAVLYVREPLRESHWFQADGRPDETPFVEQPQLIESLVAQAR